MHLDLKKIFGRNKHYMSSSGVSYQQDPFLRNKQKKLFASRSWPNDFSEKVDISRVSIESLRPWVEKRVNQLLGTEDEIVYEYCIAQLEAFDPVEKTIDPREVQINLEGFLGEEKAAVFMKELWNLMLSAQVHPLGVPQQLIEQQRLAEEEKKRVVVELKREVERKKETMRREQEESILKRERERRDKAHPRAERERKKSPSRSLSRDRRGRRARSRSRDRNYRR